MNRLTFLRSLLLAPFAAKGIASVLAAEPTPQNVLRCKGIKPFSTVEFDFNGCVVKRIGPLVTLPIQHNVRAPAVYLFATPELAKRYREENTQ